MVARVASGASRGVEVLAPHGVTVMVERNGTAADRQQRAALHPLGHRGAGGLQQRRREVGELHQGVTDQTGADGTGPRQDQGDPHQPLVEAAAPSGSAHGRRSISPWSLVNMTSVSSAWPLSCSASSMRPHLVVDQLDHGVVGRLQGVGVARGGVRRQVGSATGPVHPAPAEPSRPGDSGITGLLMSDGSSGGRPLDWKSIAASRSCCARSLWRNSGPGMAAGS